MMRPSSGPRVGDAITCAVLSGVAIATLVAVAAATVHAQRPPAAPLAGEGLAACRHSFPRRLESLLNDWSVVATWRADQNLLPIEHARSSIIRAADNCALVEQLNGTLGGMPFGITALFAAEDSSKFQLAYVDSEHGRLLEFAGAELGDTLRFVWRQVNEAKTVVVRRDYDRFTAKSFHLRSALSLDDGRTWTVVQEAQYERR